MELAILGQSQTFFGVLATLVILCALFTDSNFINKIIERIRDNTKVYSKKQCNEYRTELEKGIENTKNRISIYQDASKQRGDSSLGEATDIILDDFQLNKVSFENSMTDIEKNIDILFSEKGTDEQILTPLYSFLFCVVVFIGEEIIFISARFQNWITTLLFIFTALSFALCASLWFFYTIRTRPNAFIKQKKEYTGVETSHKDSFLMLFYCFLFFLLFYAVYTLISFKVELSKITYGLTLFLFCFIGAFSISCASVKKLTANYCDYPKTFIFRHFLYLLILSVLFTITIRFIHSYNIALVVPDLFSKSILLKEMLMFFVVLNGILLPFLLPIIRYSRYKEHIKEQIEEVSERFSATQRDIDVRLNNMNVPKST